MWLAPPTQRAIVSGITDEATIDRTTATFENGEMDDPDIDYIRPPSRIAPMLALLGILGTGATGKYAWDLRASSASQQAELGEVRSQEASCTKQLSSSRADQQAQAAERKACEDREAGAREDQVAAEKAVIAMQTDLKATREELDALRATRTEDERQLRTFRMLTAKLAKMLDTAELKVMVRDGRILIKLPAEVLFASGKAELQKRGQKALTEISAVLKQLPDRQFMVAGHSDSQPLKSSPYKNNWELSTARALTVVQFLTTVGMKPQNLVAAGYGEYDPVANNRSEAGRRENRRIELVLLPRIRELPKIPSATSALATPKTSK
jgi:chemotaxis protein MotB